MTASVSWFFCKTRYSMKINITANVDYLHLVVTFFKSPSLPLAGARAEKHLSHQWICVNGSGVRAQRSSWCSPPLTVSKQQNELHTKFLTFNWRFFLQRAGCGCEMTWEVPRFDGWYNSLASPRRGAVGGSQRWGRGSRDQQHVLTPLSSSSPAPFLSDLLLWFNPESGLTIQMLSLFWKVSLHLLVFVTFINVLTYMNFIYYITSTISSETFCHATFSFLTSIFSRFAFNVLLLLQFSYCCATFASVLLLGFSRIASVLLLAVVLLLACICYF